MNRDFKYWAPLWIHVSIMLKYENHGSSVQITYIGFHSIKDWYYADLIKMKQDKPMCNE